MFNQKDIDFLYEELTALRERIADLATRPCPVERDFSKLCETLGYTFIDIPAERILTKKGGPEKGIVESGL